MYQTLISAAQLRELLNLGAVSIIDCRFNLGNIEAGREAYLEAHIKSAVYAHLEDDLSAPRAPGNGRHPMPTPAAIGDTCARLGLRNDRQIVVYDDANGMVAARAWWMLRYVGHTAVAVLNGGFKTWLAIAGPLEQGATHPLASHFEVSPQPQRLVSVEQLDAAMSLIDAREERRFAGEIEPLDAVAGHIPGAANHHFAKNLDTQGNFRSAKALRDAFVATLGTLPGSESVHYCGSGVSACHNVLAQVHAGLPEPRLYAGSWSEWCSDPLRSVATQGPR